MAAHYRNKTVFHTLNQNDADGNLDQMLALYKTPATIRDFKQVFFYISADSELQSIRPLRYFYNMDETDGGAFIPPLNTPLYYSKIGTTREFNILDKINDLIDIRVPKDKYVIEINLAECSTDTDVSGWSSIPDICVERGSGDPNNPLYNTPAFTPVYTWSEEYGNLTALPNTTAQKRDLLASLKQSLKQTAPQTLFCRIKELANGEPYNWAVTNSGQYSIDKSHQLLVRFGDIPYSKLTLEFGHLAFRGIDPDRVTQIRDPSQNILLATGATLPIDPLRNDKSYYRDPVYLDYNSEVFNAVETPITGTFPFYPDFYKGEGGVNYAVPNDITPKGVKNIVQPANRYPFIRQDVSVPPALPGSAIMRIQGKPLFFNQQVVNLKFRFLVRILHLF